METSMTIPDGVAPSPPKSFELYGPGVFDAYNKLFTKMIMTPLEWDSIAKEFFTKGKFSKRYFSWYFSLFILTSAIGSCLHVIKNYKDIANPIPSLIALPSASLACLILSCAIVLIRNVDSIVFGFGCIKHLHIGLERQFRTTPNVNKKSMRKWKFISEIMTLLMGVGPVLLPFVLVPMGILMKVDPFAFSVPKLLPPSQICGNDAQCLRTYELITGLVKTWLLIWAACGGVQFFGQYFGMLFYWLETVSRVLDILEHVPPGRKHDLAFLQGYSALRIAFESVRGAFNAMHAFQYGFGYLMFLTCNILSIRCVNIFPIYLYWCLPFGSFSYGLYVYLWTPLDVEVNIRSTDLIKRRLESIPYFLESRSNNGGSTNVKIAGQRLDVPTKLVMRRLKIARPIVIKCGNFFSFHSGSEAIYFDKIFTQTVDGVMVEF